MKFKSKKRLIVLFILFSAIAIFTITIMKYRAFESNGVYFSNLNFTIDHSEKLFFSYDAECVGGYDIIIYAVIDENVCYYKKMLGNKRLTFPYYLSRRGATTGIQHTTGLVHIYTKDTDKLFLSSDEEKELCQYLVQNEDGTIEKARLFLRVEKSRKQ